MSLEPWRGVSVQRTDDKFTNNGVPYSAWLYMPEDITKTPVVVMAHGFAAQKDFGLQQYAEYFTAHGLTAFAFDYPNFAASAGEPRNLVNPWRSLNDWKTAINPVHTLALPVDHFAVHIGDLFQQLVQKQSEFLASHLA